MVPSATNFLFAAPPPPTEAAALFEALRARHLYVRYFPGEKTGRFLRITIGTEAQTDALLAALADLGA